MLHEIPAFGHTHDVCFESKRELQGVKVICYHCGKAFAKEETNYQARPPALPSRVPSPRFSPPPPRPPNGKKTPFLGFSVSHRANTLEGAFRVQMVGQLGSFWWGTMRFHPTGSALLSLQLSCQISSAPHFPPAEA